MSRKGFWMGSEKLQHAKKKQKIKSARDKMMKNKNIEKGLIIVNTGKGKGKSSAAFGMILRCISHDMKCAVVQFIKGSWDTGERRIIEQNFSGLCSFTQWVRVLPGKLKIKKETSLWQKKHGQRQKS